MIPFYPNDIGTIRFERTEQETEPSLTYRIDFEKGTVSGVLDGIEALRQSVFCRLSTMRNTYDIYSDRYGIPMNNLIGQTAPLIFVSIANALTETLLDDDRITGVSGFIFDTDKKTVTVSFTVSTVFGNMNFEEVSL